MVFKLRAPRRTWIMDCDDNVLEFECEKNIVVERKTNGACFITSNNIANILKNIANSVSEYSLPVMCHNVIKVGTERMHLERGSRSMLWKACVKVEVVNGILVPWLIDLSLV